MGVENTIKNMEEALEKKKAALREKSAAKVKKLKERIETKQAKIEKLSKEVDLLQEECADLESVLNVAGSETKTEPFVPGAKQKEGSQKDDSKKTSFWAQENRQQRRGAVRS